MKETKNGQKDQEEKKIHQLLSLSKLSLGDGQQNDVIWASLNSKG
jgi:hypothetical protein